MINIKRFIDKVTSMENRRKDIILSLDEARSLKDEITQILADLHVLNSRSFNVNNANRDTRDTGASNEPIKIEVNGGRW